MYQQAIQRLTDAGYEHYEVSNFALPQRRCLHNQVYWSGRTYDGCGEGAARLVDGRREVNHRSTWTYLRRMEAAQDPTSEREELPLAERMRERLAFGLRMLAGVRWNAADRSQWRRRDPPVCDAIQQLSQLGMLSDENERLRLTDAGLMLADSVASRLLSP
jgi:oxygen-independent coproporphyrinogen-3 oxidase